MTSRPVFLPVVGRELLVRARQPATHWGRAALLALAAVASWGAFASASGLRGPASGVAAFGVLQSLGFGLAFFAFVFTADCVSAERREGTLGLLFLTRLTGWDVVLGKLAAAGLTSVYALVGFTPLLMLPLVVGGVALGEVVRTALALLNLLFVALAAGLWASARRWRRRSALLLAFWTLLAWLFIPLVADGVVAYAVPHQLTAVYGLLGLPVGSRLYTVGVLSPALTFFLANAAGYSAAPHAFWASLVCVQASAWLLLANASRSIRRELAETAEGSPEVAEASVDPATETALDQLPRKPLETDPVRWLVERQRGEHVVFSLVFWVAAAPWLFNLVVIPARALRPPFVFVGASVAFSFGCHLLSSALLAFASARFFLDKRRSRELELLLPTPLGAQLAKAHWRALWRLLGPALLLLMLAFAITAARPLLSPDFWLHGGWALLFGVLSVANDLLRLVAVCWVAMWFGLRARTTAAAVVWTTALVTGFPGLACLFVPMEVVYLPVSSPAAGLPVASGLAWLASSLFLIAVNLRWIFWARRELLGDVREVLTGQPVDAAELPREALRGFFSTRKRPGRNPKAVASNR